MFLFTNQGLNLNFPIIDLFSFYLKFQKYLKNVTNKFFISDEKKLLNPQQYGFRPNYSTSIALNDICNELLHNLKENKISCTMFLDLAKAFDTIDHTILIKKLKQYGIRRTTLELLKNYLQNRKQQTLYQGTLFEYKTITCGVPRRLTL